MLDDLARAIGRHCTGDLSTDTAVPRLTVVATDVRPGAIDMLYQPMVCFVAGGAKRTSSGDRQWLNGAGTMYLTSLDVPVTATFERLPYRSAVLRLDDQVLADLLLELGEAAPGPANDPGGIQAAPMSPEVLDAVTRWVRLLDTPGDIGALAGRIEEEILYRLLGSPIGPMLRQFALEDSHVTQVRRVANWIREHYARPLSIDTIAGVAHMSAATLHRHFKNATGMSPLQFQKRLRLQEARRLLVAGGATAAVVGERVGYASATQFTREYRRAYGSPPAQDALRLRTRLTTPAQRP
jgi:AraC-like DNA-binding protein